MDEIVNLRRKRSHSRSTRSTPPFLVNSNRKERRRKSIRRAERNDEKVEGMSQLERSDLDGGEVSVEDRLLPPCEQEQGQEQEQEQEQGHGYGHGQMQEQKLQEMQMETHLQKQPPGSDYFLQQVDPLQGIRHGGKQRGVHIKQRQRRATPIPESISQSGHGTHNSKKFHLPVLEEISDN